MLRQAEQYGRQLRDSMLTANKDLLLRVYSLVHCIAKLLLSTELYWLWYCERLLFTGFIVQIKTIVRNTVTLITSYHGLSDFDCSETDLCFNIIGNHCNLYPITLTLIIVTSVQRVVKF